jgi:hypothetical protein
VIYDNNVQRNTELIRAILFKIEASPLDGLIDIEVPGSTDEEVSYHVMLLHKAGLIEATDCSSLQGHSWKATSLTWEGHEFIDAIRSDTVWNKTKEFVVAKTGTLTIEAIKAALPIVLKMMLGV